MKTLVNGLNENRCWNLVARFGRASLVTARDGRIELRGGSPSDHTEAREWISLFMHEAVPRTVLGGGDRPPDSLRRFAR